MISKTRFFSWICRAFVSVFIGFDMANACTVNQITLSDNSCVDVKFTITADIPNKNTSVSFNISASGTFYVDWGDGSAVQTIVRANTTNETYSHRYSSAGSYDIRMAGVATGYANSDTTAAISFMSSNANKSYYTAITGRLDTMFPVLGTTNNLRPRFYRTFYNCKKLTSIPENLFRNITSSYNYTFYQTFYNCSGLSGFVPPSTFGGLIQSGSQYGTQMMANIFYGTGLDTSCTNGHRAYSTGYESYWASKVSCGTEYALTYVMNGGTNYVGAPLTFWDDESTTINGVPTKADNVFIGWCSDSGLTSCSMSYTIPIYTISPQTIYAAWQPCTACATTNASCVLSVVNNTCTYATACNSGYENIQNNGAYNASCTPISGIGCAGGSYRENGVCVAVGQGYWSANNSDVRNQCPAGLSTIGYGTGADEANDCGLKLQIENNYIYLRQDRKTNRTLNVEIGNNIYYANMSTAEVKMSDNIDSCLKVDVGGTVYSVYDDSGYEYTNN